MKTFLKILLTLLILGGLGYGGWYAYGRFFGDVPEEGTVYVQSVSAITGVGPAGMRSRYSGVVEAKDVIEVDPDNELTVKECFVTAGDRVQKGTALFSYDVDSIEISFEQLKLDIQGLENGIQTGREKVESLKTRLSKAREYKKYDIQLEIQTEELEIRKKEYELTGKRKQAEDMERALNNTVVKSPVAGTVRSVRSAGGSQEYDYGGTGESSAYITIVAGDDYCVKGTVSEQTIHTLQEGMDVRIYSRVDDTVWEGTIYRINTEETKKTNRGYYYYDDGAGDRASKYDFYVALNTNEGLLMGQHVYIEPGAGGGMGEGLLLPLYYVVETDVEAYVYAVDGDGRIEKRDVALGERDEENGTVVILDGLSYLDRIAFPDGTVKVGLPASETAYVPQDGGMGADPDMGGRYDMEGLGGMYDMDGMGDDRAAYWDMPDPFDLPEADLPDGEDAPAEGAVG